MGYGDDLMATGEVKELRAIYPEAKFVIGDGVKYYWSEIFENNPYIIQGNNLKKHSDIKWVSNYLGNRPYRKYKTEQEKDRYVWNNAYSAKKGEIFFTEEENEISTKIINEIKKKFKDKKIIYIEPNVKNKKGYKNRDWGFSKWQEVVSSLKLNYVFIQGTFGKQKKLQDVINVHGLNFRTACSIIEKSDLFLGTEGGFHHAAAALNKKGVVIFGGFISPKITGYDSHSNIYIDIKGSPCGSKNICNHCLECMEKITPDIIINHIDRNMRE